MAFVRTRGLQGYITGDSPVPWLAPLVAMLVVFTIYPLFYNIWLSFHEYAPFNGVWSMWARRTGARSSTIRASGKRFPVTFTYFFVLLAIQVVLGMIIALLLDSDEPGFGLLRGLLTLTVVIPPAITGMMFLLMEDPEFGVLTYLLEAMGILSGQDPILATSSTALAGRDARRYLALDTVHGADLPGGARSLPQEPYEAAMLDGASAFQTFRRITLPMMS